MPQTEGGGTVFVGGPGSKIGLPIYGGFRPVTGSVPATPNLLFNSSGQLSFNALAPGVLQMAQVTMTAAQINAMNGTPFALVPAAGANTLILVDSIFLNAIFGSAAFASGGAISAQYGTTGTLASSTIAATFLTSFAANQAALALGALASTATSGIMNQGITLSNGTGAFTTGTGGSVVVTVYYAVISGVS